MESIDEAPYVAHLLRGIFNKLESTSPAGAAALRDLVPYCLYFEGDWCLALNRSYKVIGLPGDLWCDYASSEYDSLRFDQRLVNCRPGEIDARYLYLASPLLLHYQRDRAVYLATVRRVLAPLLATCEWRHEAA